MEEEAAVKRARKAAEAAFLQLLKDCTPASAASTNPREYDWVLHTAVHICALLPAGASQQHAHASALLP